MANFKLTISKRDSSQYDFIVNGAQKFENDCLYLENDEYFLFLNGVIFNKSKLLNKYGVSDWEKCVITLYENNGEDFFTLFKGSYNGFLYDKLENKWTIFSNFQGEKPIYLGEIPDKIIVSSRILLIKEELESNRMNLSISIEAAYMLLCHGFMLEDHTLFNEVKRLRSGFYYQITCGKISALEYYKPKNLPKNDHSENEIIETIDQLFNEAVKLQFDKDCEYGYRHLVNLSGGLDSRMVSWCANKQGYNNQLNLTFAQTGSGDELIAKSVARKLRNEWLFKSLDYGKYLSLIDSVTKVTEGSVAYYGLAHGMSVSLLLDTRTFGIKHTGQLGGIILGWKSEKYDKPKLDQGVYSKKLISKITNDVIDLSQYQNDEQFMILNRYINGTNFGSVSSTSETEIFSPFYDKNFWNYCLTIPLKYRNNHYIYKKWIIDKYPDAARIKWDKTNVPIDYKFWKDGILFYQGKAIKGRELLKKIYREMGRRFGFKYSPSLKAMNPYSSWYKMNKDLRKFIEKYYDNHKGLLDFNYKLKDDAGILFEKGKVTEKMMVLSLLSAIKVMTK